MTSGLLDPAILTFAFTPLIVSLASVVTLVFKHTHGGRGRGKDAHDAPASVLAWTVGAMPQARQEWGLAMLAELDAVPGRAARWRFALSCARAVLFMPRAETTATSERRPVLGLLAVTLPPLALPFIYVAAAILDAVGGGPMAIVKVLIVTTMAGLIAGVPLGLASRWRHERLPHLTTWGIASSIGTVAYFLIGMQWLAGVD
jgi:hypothetical protein